jgi:hypothetical protein
MKGQCRTEYPHPNGFFPPYGIRDKPGRVICDKVSEIYHFGVWQLGGESWPDIAYKYDRFGKKGCPWIGIHEMKPDVPTCLRDQQFRSYPPVIANRAATMLLIARKINALFSLGGLR